MMARECGFCHLPVVLTVDTDERREYHCSACDATETISKLSGGAWWYHGWLRKDGARLRPPTAEEMQNGHYGWQPDNGSAA